MRLLRTESFTELLVFNHFKVGKAPPQIRSAEHLLQHSNPVSETASTAGHRKCAAGLFYKSDIITIWLIWVKILAPDRCCWSRPCHVRNILLVWSFFCDFVSQCYSFTHFSPSNFIADCDSAWFGNDSCKNHRYSLNWLIKTLVPFQRVVPSVFSLAQQWETRPA